MLFLAFIGGLFTIASPCILPVIPLVFSRAQRSPWRETLPMLAGLAAAFTLAALIATTTARWLLAANEGARVVALLLLGAVGVALLSERAAVWMARPMSRIGARLLSRTDHSATIGGMAGNFLIGGAVGLLWAPCAGPILGLLIAAAATSSTAHAAALFITFALGASLVLGIVLGLGSRALTALRRAGAADVVIRRTLGAATLATAVVLALGWDQALFAKATIVNTARAEETLVRRFAPDREPAHPGEQSVTEFARVKAASRLPAAEGELPGFDGGTEWINSVPLTPAALRGKVVLVDFWTFACYNCLNALPHVKALEAKYRNKGLVVIGVHTPELAHERVVENVRREVKRLGIEYPVVIDNDYRIWNAFHNQYWPAAYYADKTGKLRFYHFGEGAYEEQDQVVAALLAEATRP